MAYKIKNKGRTAYQINIKGHIVQARTKRELYQKLDREAKENKILWAMGM
jgi:fructose-1-phosphate kinase PfkB-like protein